MKNIKYCHIPEEDEASFVFDHVHIIWDEQITFHRQKTWELSYVITGRGTRIVGDTTEYFSQGEVILIPPDMPHCWSFDKHVFDGEGKIENITLVFSSALLENSRTVFPEISGIIAKIQSCTDAISFGGSTLSQLQTILTSMLREDRVERLSSLIKLFALIASPEKTLTVGRPVIDDRKTKRLQQINMYVMNNFQRDITLDEVAGFACMAKSSFCIFFKKMTGKPFFAFLTEYRVTSSCQMLLKTDMSVAEICYASGFRDVPYYNRVFKKLKGMTPTEYRCAECEQTQPDI
ncbi:MAG: AraC family transcriptional regulator [Prevotellaceae bacterium]|jgi:AraC-like DNA-binding protein|nr:AraC family transcriptional regulator [Prevotellaceae bacterium]